MSLIFRYTEVVTYRFNRAVGMTEISTKDEHTRCRLFPLLQLVDFQPARKSSLKIFAT